MEIILTVAVAAQLCSFTLADLDALPQKSIVTTTTWNSQPAHFSGPRFSDVLHACKPRSRPPQLRVVALNDYAVHIPYGDLTKWRPILASRINGKTFPVSQKGPLWVMYPVSDFPELQSLETDSKLIWQVTRIEAVYK